MRKSRIQAKITPSRRGLLEDESLGQTTWFSVLMAFVVAGIANIIWFLQWAFEHQINLFRSADRHRHDVSSPILLIGSAIAIGGPGIFLSEHLADMTLALQLPLWLS